MSAFIAAPNALAKAAKVLGCLSAPLRTETLANWDAHPLRRLHLATAPLPEIAATLASHLTLTDPVPARLKAHLRGAVFLSEPQLERHRNAIERRYPLVLLEMLRSLCVQRLEQGLPRVPPGRGGEHALLLLGDAPENRRGLRRFLAAYGSQRADYLAHHPETVAWYRRHPSIPRRTWETGIPFSKDGISLEVESDPFEILQLGSYVGSCLAVGGLCSYSAIPALLDANKRVIYARASDRRVIARQLVAIAENRMLVCFPVYPLSARSSVKALFAEFDREFAAALGIPVYVGGPDYEIRNVLAPAWWDDGSWDFDTSAV